MASPIEFRGRLERFAFNLNGATEINGPVYNGLQRAGRKVVDEAKKNLTTAGLINTGRLRNSGSYKIVRAGTADITCIVEFDTEYATWVHDGNDPGGGYIYPRRATLLRFSPKGTSSFVFAPRVRAFPGDPYLEDALLSLQISDLT